MKQQELTERLVHSHVTAQNYMFMLTYIGGGYFCEALDVVARSLGKLTDNVHWADFSLDALKSQPEDFLQEINFEIREQAEKFEALSREIEADSLKSDLAEIWMAVMSVYVEAAADQKSFLSAAVDVVIGNHDIFPKEFLSFLVTMLMNNGMAAEINRLGAGCGFETVYLSPDLTSQIEAAFMQMKNQGKEPKGTKRKGKTDKNLLN